MSERRTGVRPGFFFGETSTTEKYHQSTGFCFYLISCYYSHNRSTSEEGNVKIGFLILLYASIQMLYNYRNKVQNVKYIDQTNRRKEILSCAKCAKIGKSW